MTTSVLYQQIDQLSRDKGIDPSIVVSAVEDAVLVATRKFYKSVEDLRSTFNKETGHVSVIKKVVGAPVREISLPAARKSSRPSRRGSEDPEADGCFRAHRRPDSKAGDSAEGA